MRGCEEVRKYRREGEERRSTGHMKEGKAGEKEKRRGVERTRGQRDGRRRGRGGWQEMEAAHVFTDLKIAESV